MALPQSLRYTGPLPAVTDLRSYTVESQSQSLTYSIGNSSSDTIQIVVPAIQNGFLDPKTLYLHFTLTNTSTDSSGNACTIYPSGSIQSIIQRHDVYSGQASASLLQTLDNYGVLAQALLDFEDPTFTTSHNSYLMGTSNDSLTGYERRGAFIVASGIKNFAIPLLSPLGVFSDKCIPLSTGFTNFFYLATGALAFVAGQAGGASTPANSATLSNVRLCYRVIETPPQITQALYASGGGGPLQIPITSWVSATAVHPASQATNSILLGISAASAKSLLFGFRTTSILSNVNADSIAYRINSNLDSYWLQIGSSVLPVNRIRSDAQALASTLQSRHLMGFKASTQFNSQNWSIANYATLSGTGMTPVGAWLGGFDLDQITGRSDMVTSGLNLNGQIVTVNLNWGSGNIPGSALQFNAHVERNTLLNFQPGSGFTVAY